MQIPQRKGDPIEFRYDEGVRADTSVESLSKLRPAFRKDGTITAGSASPISDGAAAVVVMSKAKAEELGLDWLAEIGAHGVVAGPDSTLQSQPANAIRAAAAKEGIAVAELDLHRDQRGVRRGRAGLDQGARRRPRTSSTSTAARSRVGHPIGMSGARIALHLALELQPARRRRRVWPRCAAAAARATP